MIMYERVLDFFLCDHGGVVFFAKNTTLVGSGGGTTPFRKNTRHSDVIDSVVAGSSAVTSINIHSRLFATPIRWNKVVYTAALKSFGTLRDSTRLHERPRDSTVRGTGNQPSPSICTITRLCENYIPCGNHGSFVDLWIRKYGKSTPAKTFFFFIFFYVKTLKFLIHWSTIFFQRKKL